MISVKGTIKNGVVLPLEPVKDSDEGRRVIITFVDEEANGRDLSASNSGLSLEDLIEAAQVDTGIEDLALEHDHYLYGTPKKYNK